MATQGESMDNKATFHYQTKKWHQKTSEIKLFYFEMVRVQWFRNVERVIGNGRPC